MREDRWARALRVLKAVYGYSEDLNFYEFLPKAEDLVGDEYELIDEPISHEKAVQDKNFLFLHKSIGLTQSNFRLGGSGNCVIVSEGADLDKVNVITEGKGGILFFGEKVRLRKVSVRLKSRRNSFVVGRDTTWEGGGASIIEDEKRIFIGQDCMFSSDVEFLTSDKHPIFDKKTGERINLGGSICVGDHVWMGRRVKVSKNVNVGSGGIIGQGSIVTKSTEPDSIYAGVPAKLIRSEVDWRRSLKEKSISPSESLPESC